jgi:tetratricopeptide (TPR) repeat protein
VIQLAFGTRLENAVISYVAYLGKSLWPSHLAIYYPYPKAFSAMLVAGSVLFLSAASVGAILLGRRHPYLPVGWFWYLGTLVPVIGLVQVGTQAMADRYTYLPLIGVFIIVAWGVPELLSRSSRYTATMATLAGAVLILCAMASKSQVRHWESTAALWTHALEVTTDNYEAHNNLGAVLARTGRRDEAIAEFTEAIRLRPAYADAHNNLGLALATQRKLKEALPHLLEAIRLDPGHARAHANLGVVWQALGRRAEAIQEYETVLRLEPNNANVRSALAAVKRQTK